MDITKILQDLGIDFSNPDSKKGATEAIQAILSSRIPMGNIGGMTPAGGQIDVEIDPDLIQPSIKQPSGGSGDAEIEINDEEDILSQVKRNDSEDNFDDETEDSSDSSSFNSSNESSSDNASSNTSSIDDSKKADADDNSDTEDAATDDEDAEDTAKESEDDLEDSDFEVDTDSEANEASDFEDNFDSEDEDTTDEATDDTDTDGDSDGSSDENADIETDDEEADSDENDYDFDDEDKDDFDIEDEEDLVDDNLKDIEDAEIKSKTDARKIKRERTLAAAKNTLANAQASKASPALIRELEKAIEALEALTEAVAKHIKDVSDEEFNLLVNRVFDAIDALGDKSLTFTTDEERQLRAKEIKADMSSSDTQHELSAEDAALIRAEHQASKARDKEAAKYQTRARGSFKGFQDFLSSLYRAVALQVSAEEERTDSWSAISRRNSGAGVLQQGKLIKDLNNKKIPVIDFYFDQSASWSGQDIAVGEKAVAALADLEAKGSIKINVYYFSDGVHTDAASARAEGGTGAWNEIVKNVISTNATNVIIMTDSDMESYWVPWRSSSTANQPLSYTVPGYVWYLWKGGSNAPRLPRDLKGRGGVQQFSFSSSDV